jgi:hypothetical protein
MEMGFSEREREREQKREREKKSEGTRLIFSYI